MCFPVGWFSMVNHEANVVGEWIEKAERDLASALRLLDGTPPYLDTAVYHCQQAGEKALKAFLVAREQRIAPSGFSITSRSCCGSTTNRGLRADDRGSG